MLAAERKREIVALVIRERRVVVTELSRRFGVTEETVRRDLHVLERDGLLTRTHGGALPRLSAVEDLPYPLRQTLNAGAKEAIGAKAAALVHDGQAIMIDSSSTAAHLLPNLTERRGLTIITNSVRMLSDPATGPHAIVSVGGELRQQSMTFVGPLAIQALAQFRVDHAFISCKALSRTGGVMDASIADADVKRAFVAQAARVTLLADGDKFDASGLIRVCDFDRVATLVTDRLPAEEWRDLLARKAVELVV